MLILSVILLSVNPPSCNPQSARFSARPGIGNPQCLQSLFAAIRSVETGGQPNGGRDAIGAAGELGPYQIKREYWLDAQVPGSFEQVRDRAYAERVILAYWVRYCPTALRNLDFQTLARVHNGGPKGHTKAATIPYWQRVQARLAK